MASDFTPVSSLYRSLEIGPYEYLKETGFIGFAKRYRHYLYGFAALLILILLYTASVRRIVSIRTRDLTIALKEKDKAEKEARESRENLFQLEKGRRCELNCQHDVCSRSPSADRVSN